MARLSYLMFFLANGRHVTLAETDSASSIRTLKIGMDTNYPPYAVASEDGELGGFAIDFANGMNGLCPNLNIEMVYETWANCWEDSDGGKIGKSIEDGTIDACTAYIHSHIRDERAEFSGAMLDDNKAAGLLVHLDENGNPSVGGMDDLKGKTIIDISGWAPSADALKFLTNHCTDKPYAIDDINVIVADVDETSDNPNDVAMRMLHEGQGDAIFLMADMGSTYKYCPEDAVWDCDLWHGFGTKHAYIQSGQFGYVKNGTTFAISALGSGIQELLTPCMSAFMASNEYYKLCSKYNIVDQCYKNEFFDDDVRSVSIWDKHTTEQLGDCRDGYCSCSVGVKEEDPDIAASNSDDSFPGWAIAVIVVGSVFAIAAVAGGYKLHQKRKRVREQKQREEEQATNLKMAVLQHAAARQAAGGASVEAGSTASRSTRTPPVRKSWKVEES